MLQYLESLRTGFVTGTEAAEQNPEFGFVSLAPADGTEPGLPFLS